MKNKLNNVMFQYYYVDNDKKLLELNIPIESIEILEIHKICESFIYLGKGKYEYIDRCGSLELRLSMNKLSGDIVNVLSSKICLVSIMVKSKYYNLPYYSSDSKSNNLQKIKIRNNKVFIDMNEEDIYVRK